tara:strand:+ start:105 stop:407 length:303 start_codon:yes stop_codon:yes gene_type:complete
MLQVGPSIKKSKKSKLIKFNFKLYFKKLTGHLFLKKKKKKRKKEKENINKSENKSENQEKQIFYCFKNEDKTYLTFDIVIGMDASICTKPKIILHCPNNF